MSLLPFKVARTLGRSHMARTGDVVEAKRALARLGHYTAPASGIQPWPDEALFAGLEDFQRRNGLAADGEMRPSGPTEAAIGRALAGLGRPAGTPGFNGTAADVPQGRLFDVAGAVGVGRVNRPDDVVSLKHALALSGHYPDGNPEDPAFDLPLLHAIRAFQGDAGVTPDGWLAPDGETARALDGALNPVIHAVEAGDPQQGQPEGPEGEVQTAAAAGQARREGDAWQTLQNYPGGMFGGFPGGGGGGGGRSRPLIPVPPPPMTGGTESFPPHPDPRPDGIGTPADPPKIETLPGREALEDDIVKEMTKPLESHRGNAWTQRGNDIVAEECRNVLKELYPDDETFIKHIAGATQDGKGLRELSEIRVPRPDAKPGDSKGSRYPDLSWSDTRSDRLDNSAHLNTATTRKSSTPNKSVYTSREQESFEGLIKNLDTDENKELYRKAGKDLATIMDKYEPGMTEEEYRKNARKACEEVFEKWLGKPAPARN
jgi:peptidoglycan hydrolase-like protein with peptidoglycan-binding domain